MKDLLLDRVTGDLAVVNGDLVFTSTLQEMIRQQVQVTLKTFRGEWSFNTNFGVPYVENENNPIQILGKYPKTLVDLYIREAITSVAGVVSIDFYESILDKPSQIIKINFRATVESGTLSDELSIQI